MVNSDTHVSLFSKKLCKNVHHMTVLVSKNRHDCA